MCIPLPIHYDDLHCLTAAVAVEVDHALFGGGKDDDEDDSDFELDDDEEEEDDDDVDEESDG